MRYPSHYRYSPPESHALADGWRSSAAHSRDGAAVFQVDAPCCGKSSRYAASNGPAQKRGRLGWLSQAMLLDLVVLQSDRAELPIGEGAAMEQESDPAGPARLRTEEVDAHEPPINKLKTALLAGLAPAGVPRRLPVRVDLPARNRPALLVAGLEDQQPP